jgi:transcriptional regulator with XRE-family HTH domain
MFDNISDVTSPQEITTMRLNNPLMAREEAALRWRLALGGYVREHRLAKEMTQDEVTAAVGWNSKQVLSGIETGRTSVPSDRLTDLADALGVEHSEFAKQVLRYQDPWTYAALFGADEKLRHELEIAPTHMGKRRGPRH